MSDVTLALPTANSNSRIRRDGLKVREVWTQRDQLTDEQLPIVDRQLILSQNKTPQVVSVGCNGVWVMGNVVVCECGK